MGNENLRAALQSAGVPTDEFADIVQVDARTVRRWLSGVTPHPRQRAKVARALDTTQQHLWPHAATAQAPRAPTAEPRDPIAAYEGLGDLDAPDWKAMMRDAAGQIELLGGTLKQVLETPGLPELLAAKASIGCRVRVLLSDPGPHLAPYLARDGVEIRVLDRPAQQTVYRFDQQLLFILHLDPHDEHEAPLLHVGRASDGGLFDRLAVHFQHCWDDASEALDPDVDVYGYEYDDEDEPSTGDHKPDQQPDVEEKLGATRADSPATPPRRWPGRTA